MNIYKSFRSSLTNRNNSTKLIKSIDITRYVCNHLIGENQTLFHRICAGTIVMVLGVGLTELCKLSTLGLVHFIGDMYGFLMHGAGTIPYIEFISKIGKHEEQPKSTDST